MKKLIAVLICALMLIGAVPSSVHAAEQAVITISASADSANPGDEILFEASIAGKEAYSSFGIVLEYDKTVFEVVEGKCTLEDTFFSVFDEDKGFAFMYQKETVPNGQLGTFKLRVKADAQSCDAEISGITSAKSGGEAAAVAVESAVVKISGKTSAPQTAPTQSSVPETEEAKAPQQPTKAAAEQTESNTAATESDPVSQPVTQPQASETAPEGMEQLQTELEDTAQTAATESGNPPAVSAKEQKRDQLVILLAALICLTIICVIILIARISGGRRRGRGKHSR